MKSATRTSRRIAELPTTYAELVAMLPPRPIHDDTDYRNVMEAIDRLAGFELNADQSDYLEALSLFVETYERERWPIGKGRLAPLDVLKTLLDEHGMSGSDLGRLLGTRTLGPAILSGARRLSKTHIRTLAEHFHVSPAVFID